MLSVSDLTDRPTGGHSELYRQHLKSLKSLVSWDRGAVQPRDEALHGYA